MSFSSPQRIRELLGLNAPGMKPSEQSLPVVTPYPKLDSALKKLTGTAASVAIGASIVSHEIPSVTAIQKNTGNTNDGASPNAKIRRDADGTIVTKVLLKPDAASCPFFRDNAGTEEYLIGAVLEVRGGLSSQGSTIGKLSVNRIKKANATWQEGTKAGAAGSGTDSTWNKLSVSPDLNWAGSAGLESAGTDYETLEMGSAQVVPASGNRAYYLRLDLEELKRALINDSGLVLQFLETRDFDQIFYVQLDDSASFRPTLHLEYSSYMKPETYAALIYPGATGVFVDHIASAGTNDKAVGVGGEEILLENRTNGLRTLNVFAQNGIELWYATVSL